MIPNVGAQKIQGVCKNIGTEHVQSIRPDSHHKFACEIINRMIVFRLNLMPGRFTSCNNIKDIFNSLIDIMFLLKFLVSASNN